MNRKEIDAVASIHSALQIARENILDIEYALENAQQTEQDLLESFSLPRLERVFLPAYDSVEVLTAACSIFTAAGIQLGLPDVGQSGFCSYVVSNDKDGAPLLVLLNNDQHRLAIFIRSEFAEALINAELAEGTLWIEKILTY